MQSLLRLIGVINNVRNGEQLEIIISLKLFKIYYIYLNPDSEEYLSLSIHDVLQNTNNETTEQENKQLLDEAIHIVEYIRRMGLLKLHHKQYCIRRLLFNDSVSLTKAEKYCR